MPCALERVVMAHPNQRRQSIGAFAVTVACGEAREDVVTPESLPRWGCSRHSFDTTPARHPGARNAIYAHVDGGQDSVCFRMHGVLRRQLDSAGAAGPGR